MIKPMFYVLGQFRRLPRWLYLLWIANSALTCCVSFLLVAVFTAGCEQLQKKKPALYLEYSGRAVSGLFSSEFVLKVWHQHPGTVHNGTLHMQATGAYVSGGGSVSETFSFDAWPPNEENARTFKFEIDGVGPDLQIRFDMEVQTEETGERTPPALVWANSGWDMEARIAELQKDVEEVTQSLKDESSATQ